jgi:hypothetical protein
MNISELKSRLEHRAARRAAYACRSAHAYRVAHLSGGWNQPDNEGARFVDSLDDAGLRLAGYADAYIRINHTGWYCDTSQHDTFRGAVLQFPARKRRPVFIAAYREPWNDGYRVDVRGGLFGDAQDAAHAADEFARIAAEHARDYDEAWQSGARYAALGELIGERRREALALIREIKAARQAFPPAICQTLRVRFDAIGGEVRRARQDRAALRDAGAWFVHHCGAAFNEGAGEAVFAV